MWLPRTERDYHRAVGDGSGSNIVQAVILWIARTFPEAPLVVRDAEGNVIVNHPMTLLVRRPNPYYTGLELWQATLTDYITTGNAYWIKARNGRGKPLELWWMPARYITPAWDEGSEEFITHYEYTVDGATQRFERADVVHFRYGLDPINPRRGLSPIGSALREIFTDDEAANFTASLLTNLGVPGVILSPGTDDGMIDPDDAEAMKAGFRKQFGGDKRGEPMIISTKASVHVLSFTPQQMDLKALRRIPEERVSALLGIPAVVVGLGAGLDRSTYNNMAEAREQAYESNIIPTGRLLAAALDLQLLPDFDTNRGNATGFDYSGVRVLQDDQDKLFERLGKAVDYGYMTVAEARTAVGLESQPSDDVYLRRRLSIAIPQGEDSTAYVIAAFSGGGVPLIDPLTEMQRGDNSQQPEDADQDNSSDSADDEDDTAGGAKALLPGGVERKLSDEEAATLEARLGAAVGAVLVDLLAGVVDDIMAGVTEPDLGGAVEAMQAAIVPALVNATTAQAAAAGVAIGVPADVALVNQAALAWAREYSFGLVTNLNATTQSVVRQAVAQFVATPGMTRGQLVDLLRPAFGPARAEMIAVTEVTRAVSEGQNIYQRIMRDAGIEMERVWRTNNDDRVCPVCGPLNSKSEDDWRDSLPDGPPAHVRCRCTTTLRLKR